MIAQLFLLYVCAREFASDRSTLIACREVLPGFNSVIGKMVARGVPMDFGSILTPRESRARQAVRNWKRSKLLGGALAPPVLRAVDELVAASEAIALDDTIGNRSEFERAVHALCDLVGQSET